MQDFSDYGALPRRRGSGSWLSHAIVAVLAAGIASDGDAEMLMGTLRVRFEEVGQAFCRRPASSVRFARTAAADSRALEHDATASAAETAAGAARSR